MRRRLRRVEPIEDRKQLIERLRRIAVFDRVPPEWLIRLAMEAEPVAAPAGRDVIREGRIPDSFFVVVDGELDVLSRGEEGGEPSVVNEFGPDDFFGEVGLLEGMPAVATVRAKTDCTLYRIKGQSFLGVIDQAPVLSEALLDRIRQAIAVSYPSYRPAVVEAAKPALGAVTSLLQDAADAGGVPAALAGPVLPRLLAEIADTARVALDLSTCRLDVEGEVGATFEARSNGDGDGDREHSPKRATSVPITLDGRKRGTLHASRVSRDLIDADRALLSRFAEQAALALELAESSSELGTRALRVAASEAVDAELT